MKYYVSRPPPPLRTWATIMCLCTETKPYLIYATSLAKSLDSLRQQCQKNSRPLSSPAGTRARASQSMVNIFPKKRSNKFILLFQNSAWCLEINKAVNQNLFDYISSEKGWVSYDTINTNQRLIKSLPEELDEPTKDRLFSICQMVGGATQLDLDCFTLLYDYHER